jgi:hypothetical protein
VAADQQIAPYDLPMASRPIGERREWAELVANQLAAAFPRLKGVTFEIHAGAAYTGSLAPLLEERGAVVTAPLAGLGLGKSLAWYIQAA